MTNDHSNIWMIVWNLQLNNIKRRKIMMKVTGSVLGFAAVLGLPFLVNAANLLLKNDTTSEVDVIIEPGEGVLVGHNAHEIRHTLKTGESREVKVTKADIGADTFSVTGKAPIMPSIHNKTDPLSVDRNYRIVFATGKMGGVVSNVESLSDR
jgi:hypothetical protein